MLSWRWFTRRLPSPEAIIYATMRWAERWDIATSRKNCTLRLAYFAGAILPTAPRGGRVAVCDSQKAAMILQVRLATAKFGEECADRGIVVNAVSRRVMNAQFGIEKPSSPRRRWVSRFGMAKNIPRTHGRAVGHETRNQIQLTRAFLSVSSAGGQD
jgi:hypothetical protein